MTRSFLFLQGPQSPFFHTLGRAIEKAGCLVRKVNVCGGDDFLWPSQADTVCYRGWKATREAWPAFIAGLYERFGWTFVEEVDTFRDESPRERLYHLAL